MATIGTLGDVVFAVSKNQVRTFQDLSIESSASYAKHNRHNLKPILEFQGNQTDTLSLKMHLSIYLGIDVEEQLNKIDTYMMQGKILTLIVGQKRYGTKWVIKSHSKGYTRFDGAGNLLVAESKVSLEEYADR